MNYNEKSAKKFGWDPQDFGVDGFGDELTEAVKQHQERWGIEADGMVGHVTYRRLLMRKVPDDTFIICNGQPVDIQWEKVISISHPGALVLPDENLRKWRDPEDVRMIVTHWDVCKNSRQCFRVFERSGLSSHFSIDNDGTIWQFADPARVGLHAGVWDVNMTSIGVDLSNAYYPETNEWYRRNGFPARKTVYRATVHGKQLDPFLGFYPVQVRAYKELLRTLCGFYDIPFEVPRADGKVVNTVTTSAKKGLFRGVIGHYHCKRTKKDPASLEMDRVCTELKIEEEGVVNLDSISSLMENDL